MPETTLLLFLANGTLAGCVLDGSGVVVANGARDVVAGRRGRELGVEGVEYAHRWIAAATILVAFSGVLVVRWADGGRSGERRYGSR